MTRLYERGHRHWIDRVLRGLSWLCVFWAGAAFALGSLSFVALLIAGGIAWGCTD